MHHGTSQQRSPLTSNQRSVSPAHSDELPIQPAPRWSNSNSDMPPENRSSNEDLPSSPHRVMAEITEPRRTPPRDPSTPEENLSSPPVAARRTPQARGSFSIDSILSSETSKKSRTPSPPATASKRDLSGDRDSDSPPAKRTSYSPSSHGDISVLRTGEKSPLTAPGIHGRPEYSFAPITPTPHWYPWIQASPYLHYAYEGECYKLLFHFWIFHCHAKCFQLYYTHWQSKA